MPSLDTTVGERLVRVADGSGDIAVGISGFGSAEVSPDRWRSLAELSGRTTYALHYDAQEMPWDRPPQSIFEVASYAPEMVRRWTAARLAAMGVSEYLSQWIERWLAADRKVLIVGFSLGGYVAWRGCRSVADPRVDAILISAAIGDRPEVWEGADKMGRLINVYSRDDMALRRVYPFVVDGHETPAAGLGPIESTARSVTNIDATDLIGWDHLWASDHIDRLVELALGCLHASQVPNVVAGSCPFATDDALLSLGSYARLLRWVMVLPEVTLMFRRAMDGDPDAVRALERLDQFSLADGRLPLLLDAGLAMAALSPFLDGAKTSQRGQVELSGLIRLWIDRAGPAPLPAVGAAP